MLKNWKVTLFAGLIALFYSLFFYFQSLCNNARIFFRIFVDTDTYQNILVLYILGTSRLVS
jgi:hypothetical protein